MNYTVDYFIKKFEAIPESGWCIHDRHDRNGRHCAHGWCDADRSAQTGEEIAFRKIAISNREIMLKMPGFALVNNGDHPGYQQGTPKQRILAALRDIKALQVEYKDITKELAVLPVEETVDKILSPQTV